MQRATATAIPANRAQDSGMTALIQGSEESTSAIPYRVLVIVYCAPIFLSLISGHQGTLGLGLGCGCLSLGFWVAGFGLHGAVG